MKQLLQCNNNSNSYKEISRLKKTKNKKTRNGNSTNESRGQCKTIKHTQTNIDIKIYNNSHSNIQEKTNCTNSQAKGRTLTPQHQPTCSPLFVSRSCFVLARHINLIKERNKRARCLRVDALTIKRTPLASSPPREQGEVQRPLSPMF